MGNSAADLFYRFCLRPHALRMLRLDLLSGTSQLRETHNSHLDCVLSVALGGIS